MFILDEKDYWFLNLFANQPPKTVAKEKIIELIKIKYNTSPALWKIGTDQ